MMGNYPVRFGKQVTDFHHFLGLNGLPRRIPDYADAYIGFNNIITLGSFLTVISVILFLYIVSSTIFINKKYYIAPVKYSKFISSTNSSPHFFLLLRAGDTEVIDLSAEELPG